MAVPMSTSVSCHVYQISIGEDILHCDSYQTCFSGSDRVLLESRVRLKLKTGHDLLAAASAMRRPMVFVPDFLSVLGRHRQSLVSWQMRMYDNGCLRVL